MVTFQNWGPSTLGPVFPDGHLSKLGTVHAGTCFPGRSPLPTGDRPRQRPFPRTVIVWSGAGRYKATCHPRLGGACEAIGLVRKGQAGVAGAARPRRKESRLCDAKEAAPGRKESRLYDANKATRDAGKTGTSADQRQERGGIVAGVVTRNRYVSGGGGCCRRRRRS